ncbi:NADH:flavin oxidoreductase/NADH oxidase [bacterium]|nr:NADH:flavin oxidoreductase/NADH oxidase [bacterium]
MADTKLFSPLSLRGLTFKNRIFVSPMCQYSATDGVPNDWHLVHLGSRAVGGAALVMAEATAVRAIGRISPSDLGLWNEIQQKAFGPITRFIKAQGAIAGIQLAHAGRKASLTPFSDKQRVEVSAGGWVPEAPSAIPFSAVSPTPREMGEADLRSVLEDFVAATRRAEAAGFEVVELHMAHGYLLHEFLSPLSNTRQDGYGGSLENRMRFPLEIAGAVRKIWPSKLPLFVRISATDWAPQGGWDLDQSLVLAAELKKLGVDLIDCSSGGTLEKPQIPVKPGYQVPFSQAIREKVGIATNAVGLITEAHQAEDILQKGHADTISLAREFLRDPYFPLHAARALGVELVWPQQYERAKPR